jgi:hypothetical protein
VDSSTSGIICSQGKGAKMERISQKKKSALAVVLATIMGLLAATTVITTASGCLVCRDCGPKQPFNTKTK